MVKDRQGVPGDDSRGGQPSPCRVHSSLPPLPKCCHVSSSFFSLGVATTYPFYTL